MFLLSPSVTSPGSVFVFCLLVLLVDYFKVAARSMPSEFSVFRISSRIPFNCELFLKDKSKCWWRWKNKWHTSSDEDYLLLHAFAFLWIFEIISSFETISYLRRLREFDRVDSFSIQAISHLLEASFSDCVFKCALLFRCFFTCSKPH